MSTNSSIAIQRNDGTVTGIYCHWDGYLSYNGAILYEHYNTTEKIEALIALGDLSILGAAIEPNPEKTHTFEDYQSGVCVAYHRDRGEPEQNTAPHTGFSIVFYHKYIQQYNYLWRDGEWWVGYRTSYEKKTPDDWERLVDALMRDGFLSTGGQIDYGI